MSERDGEPEPTHPYLAKPTSPSGETPPPTPEQQPSPYAPYQQQPYQQPYQPYGAAPYQQPFRQAHPSAGTAMGLGIASLVCAVATPFVCVTLPGFLCGPFAIALAVRAQRDMRATPGAYSNEGAATTGLVTGIIGTVVGLAMIVLVVLFATFFFGIIGLSSSTG